jgi:hypothetical protein
MPVDFIHPVIGLQPQRLGYHALVLIIDTDAFQIKLDKTTDLKVNPG